MSPHDEYEFEDDDLIEEDNRIVRRNRLYKNPRKGKVAGVCAGVADYFGWDVTVVRICTVIAIFATGYVLLAYFLAAWLLPKKPRQMYKSQKEDRFWRDVRVKPSETAKSLAFKFKEMERRTSQIETHITSREAQLRREFKNL